MTLTGAQTWRRVRTAIPVPNPAAGAEWSISVPSGQSWRLLAAYADLTCSATVATRTTAMGAQLGTRTVFEKLGSSATANQTVHFEYLPLAFNTSGFSLTIVAIIPDLTIGAGGRFYSATSNLKAGDQWTNITLYAEVVTARPDAHDGRRIVDGIFELVGAMPRAGG